LDITRQKKKHVAGNRDRKNGSCLLKKKKGSRGRKSEYSSVDHQGGFVKTTRGPKKNSYLKGRVGGNPRQISQAHAGESALLAIRWEEGWQAERKKKSLATRCKVVYKTDTRSSKGGGAVIVR